jgi:hypothetical protein
VRGTGEGVPSDGLCRPGVDEAEGAEQHGGPEGWKTPRPPSGSQVKFGETHNVPLPGAPTIGVLYRRL